jgi:hypothetical protein
MAVGPRAEAVREELPDGPGMAVLRRLERHGWTLELPDPVASTQSELWAGAHFAGVEQARAAARPFVTEPPVAHRE